MQQREQQATATRRILERTKKLTSGTAFAHGLVGVHCDAVWEHTLAYNTEKTEKEEAKQRKRREDQSKRKMVADEIRKRSQETWRVNDIEKLLTYKRQKGDPTNKSFNGDRNLLLNEWNQNRKHRLTPPPTPIVQSELNFGDDDDEMGDAAEI